MRRSTQGIPLPGEAGNLHRACENPGACVTEDHLQRLPEGIDPLNICIHELIEKQAQRTPDSVAVIYEKQQLSYGELDRQANQLARYLRKLGVGPDVLVGIYVERSLKMVVGLLGILKAGGAYVPLDPSYPIERIRLVMSEAKPLVLLTEKGLLENWANMPTVVLLDADREKINLERGEDLTKRGALPKDLAYVIYTSGSTGTPKGVAIEHRSAVNLLLSAQSEPGLVSQDVLLAVTTLSFDISVLEVFLPLITGARLVLASTETARNGQGLLDLMNQSRATIMQATPATWRILIEAGWQATTSLKVLCGGEAMSLGLAGDLTLRSPAVWNLYGPTETTVWSSMYRLTGHENGQIPIGRPLSNTQFYILDENLKPALAGTPGELFIGGHGLARGYLNRPDTTAEKFVANPFEGSSGKLLYRTGDLVRLIENGNVEYLGRLDHQIKLRGFRIELGEIETTLARHSDVKAAVMLAREDVPGERRLIAYFTRKNERPVSVEVLRQFLKARLPEYMVPVHFIQLDAFPLMPNQKVDRTALPSPEKAMARKSVLPRNRIETQLIAIWQEILQISQIGLQDNFFDLGGHSFLAIRVFAQIERIFGRRLPMSALFQAPTVEQLAALITTSGENLPWSSLVALRTGPKGGSPLFLVPGLNGSVLSFADLARLMGADRPLYGLQSRGLDGRHEPFKRIEEIASHFIAEIRAVQKKGPYFLGGACIGGIVAYEMAQQLVATGEKVAFLALFDTWPPASIRMALRPPRFTLSSRFNPVVFLCNRISHSARAMLKTSPVNWFDNLSKGFKTVGEMVRKRDIYRGGQANLFSDRVSRANLQAGARYSPKPYPGRLLMFMASERKFGALEDGRFVWRDLASGGWDVHKIPAEDSGSMVIMPHVSQLAELLKASIFEAQQDR